MISIGLMTDYLITALVAGVLGAAAMELVMWLISRANWVKGSMIVALGSLFTRSRTNAFGTGVVVHALSAIGFALLYTLLMDSFGLARFPAAFFVGIGFGVIHGIIVSLALVWVVAERHPLEEFTEAGFAVGVTHFAGHVAYGAMVGLVIALTALICG
jgi:hypothetical protein